MEELFAIEISESNANEQPDFDLKDNDHYQKIKKSLKHSIQIEPDVENRIKRKKNTIDQFIAKLEYNAKEDGKARAEAKEDGEDSNSENNSSPPADLGWDEPIFDYVTDEEGNWYQDVNGKWTEIKSVKKEGDANNKVESEGKDTKEGENNREIQKGEHTMDGENGGDVKKVKAD